MNNENMEYGGNINISDEVVSIIASRAASAVSGVAGMVNTISAGFAEFLGKKNLSKGVKITKSEDDVSVDLFIIVEYGAKIPDVAWEIQEKTKNEIEAMTGLNVTAINVNVEGVSVPKENIQSDSTTSEESASEEINAETDVALEENINAEVSEDDYITD